MMMMIAAAGHHHHLVLVAALSALWADAQRNQAQGAPPGCLGPLKGHPRLGGQHLVDLLVLMLEALNGYYISLMHMQMAQGNT